MGLFDNLSCRKRDLLACSLLVCVGIIVYGNTYHVPWYFDDHLNIVENQVIHSMAGVLGQLFTPRGPALLTFAINYSLNGESLFGYHLVNNLIHITTTLVIYLILKRVTRGSPGWALAGAMIFLCHPLQTQAVTYIVQRMASLCGLFSFLSLYGFIRGREVLASGCSLLSVRHICWYVAMLLFSALAVATKQNAAFLPVGLLLFDRLLLPRDQAWSRGKSVVYLLPFFFSPLIIAMKLLVFPMINGIPLTSIGFAEYVTSPTTYFVTQFSVLWIYIRLLFLPYGQMLDYYYPFAVEIITFSNMIAFLGLAGLGALAFRLRGSMPSVSFGIGWFFAALAVESSFIPLDPLFEHRLYIPMFGFVVAVIYLLRLIPFSRVRNFAAIGAISIFALITFQRNALWADPVAFYEDNQRKAPHNPRVQVELARQYMLVKRYDEAQGFLLKAARLSPDSANVYTYLATLYDLMGKHDEAISTYKKALGFDPSYVKAYIELAVAYSTKNDFDVAEALLRKAIAQKPDHAVAHYNLGVVLYKQDKKKAALDEFRISLKLAPYDADAMYNLALVNAELGAIIEAHALVPRMKAIDPDRAAKLVKEIGQVGQSGQ